MQCENARYYDLEGHLQTVQRDGDGAGAPLRLPWAALSVSLLLSLLHEVIPPFSACLEFKGSGFQNLMGPHCRDVLWAGRILGQLPHLRESWLIH